MSGAVLGEVLADDQLGLTVGPRDGRTVGLAYDRDVLSEITECPRAAQPGRVEGDEGPIMELSLGGGAVL
jgi:hypothetical protein